MTQFGTSKGSNSNSPNAKVEDNDVLDRKLFAWTRVIVTVIVLAATLYVILPSEIDTPPDFVTKVFHSNHL